MPATLLDLNSSPLGENSVSRRLTGEFVQNWQAANPDGTVLYRDLTTTSIPPVNIIPPPRGFRASAASQPALTASSVSPP